MIAFNHRYQGSTDLRANGEDVRRIAITDPKLALEHELQGLINKGALGFQTRKDRARIWELSEKLKGVN